jgi:putative copper export protein
MSGIFLASVDQVFTGYGLMLGLKLGGFAGVLAIANFNRTRLVPAIASGDAGAASRFRRVLIGEMLALASVVVLTVLMTGFFAPEGLHGSFDGEHAAG